MLSRIRTSEAWDVVRSLPRAAGVRSKVWWLLIGVRGLLPAAFIISTGALVGAVQHHHALAVPLAAVALLFVAMNALGPLEHALSWDIATRLSRWLHDKMLHASIDPPGLAHLEHPALADKLAFARDFDLARTGPPIDYSLPEIASGISAMLGGATQLAVLAAYRWWAPIVVGAAWLSTFPLLHSASSWRGRSSPEVVEEQRRARYEYSLAVEAPAAKEIRVFGLGGWLVGTFRDRSHKLMRSSWKARRLYASRVNWCIAIIVAANVLVFWLLARDVTSGAVTLARGVVFVQATIAGRRLAHSELDWWISTVAQPVHAVLRLEEQMRPAGALPNGERRADQTPREAIVLRDVCFSYTPDGPKVLDGLSLTIPAGSSMAIVGVNGAGKTTLAKLLCRFYDPTSGTIEVDGVDLRTLEIGSWHERVAAVFQDFVRYELPLRDNVVPAGGADEVIHHALAQARAEGLAGLDQILSRAYEGGTDLSGGQWQRIALARALAKVNDGAGLVLLDEPTAQLDVRGEAEIFDRLLEATRGRTTLLISHRFSTVRHADRICVIEHGRAVETGTHDELMSRRGRYAEMFELQASRFEDEVDV